MVDYRYLQWMIQEGEYLIGTISALKPEGAGIACVPLENSTALRCFHHWSLCAGLHVNAHRHDGYSPSFEPMLSFFCSFLTNSPFRRTTGLESIVPTWSLGAGLNLNRAPPAPVKLRNRSCLQIDPHDELWADIGGEIILNFLNMNLQYWQILVCLRYQGTRNYRSSLTWV